MSEAGHDGQAAIRQRRTSIVACERCRRRKIKCSGQQPCATCARFGVRCVKSESFRERSSSNPEQVDALVERIRILEARLAECNGVGRQSGLSMDGNFDYGRPSLRVNTNVAQETIPYPNQPSTAETNLNIPMIQITGPQSGPPSPLTAASSSPSVFSATSNSASSDTQVSSTGAITWYNDPNWLPISPTSAQVLSSPEWSPIVTHNDLLASSVSSFDPALHSRRSSISSFAGIDQGLLSLSMGGNMYHLGNDPMGLDEAGQPWNSETSHFQTIPSRQQANNWAVLAIDQTRLSLQKNVAAQCIQTVYDDMDFNGGAASDTPTSRSMTSFSLPMARCIVFLLLCIGIKVSGSDDKSTMDSCYAVAHREMRRADFWTEAGAMQVTELLQAITLTR